MDSTFIVEPAAWQIIATSCKNAFPEECCGFIFGSQLSDETRIVTAMEVRNVTEADKQGYFAIHSDTYTEAENYALQNQLTLLGIYHSHPDQIALPSISDYQFALPNFLYVIVSVIEAEIEDVKAWLMDEAYDRFNEQNLQQLLSTNKY